MDPLQRLIRAVAERLGGQVQPPRAQWPRAQSTVEVKGALPLPNQPFPAGMDRMVLGGPRTPPPATYLGQKLAGQFLSSTPDGWDPLPPFAAAQEEFGIFPPMKQLPQYSGKIQEAFEMVGRDFPHTRGLTARTFPSPELWGLNALGVAPSDAPEIRLNPALGRDYSPEGIAMVIAHEMAHRAQSANTPNYKGFHGKYGYWEDPDELQARAVENDYGTRLQIRRGGSGGR